MMHYCQVSFKITWITDPRTILSIEAEVPVVESASANHFLGKGINLPKCLNL